jgi:transaldolase/glucose-6-phosphate isomerase
MRAVGEQLSKEGVDKFAQSFDKLFAVIAAKRQALEADMPNRQSLSLGHKMQDHVDETLTVLERDDFSRRLWSKDPSLWKAEPERQALIADRRLVDDGRDDVAHRELTARQTRSSRPGSHVVLLGMGGSSLAPEVLPEGVWRRADAPDLIVLDSTDPAAIRSVGRKIDPGQTLFLVSSKSGTTTETRLLAQFFADKVRAYKGDRAGENFLAITDPGTPLEALSREMGFRRVFPGPADVGGRFSALTISDLVRLRSSAWISRHCWQRDQDDACVRARVKAADNPGLVLGVVLGELWKAGRDKLTFRHVAITGELGLLG